MALGFVMIATILVIKYKPAYKISFMGQELGYVTDKTEFEEKLNQLLEEKEDPTIAFKTLVESPECQLKLVENKEKVTEEEILEKIEENLEVRYTMYAITINDVPNQYVATLEEAEKVVEQVKSNHTDYELNISMKQLYTDEKPEIVEETVAVANVETQAIPTLIASQQVKVKPIAVINGIEIANKPISGTITSRFGVSSRIRKSTHTGLDIAATSGTPIKACSEGTVVFSGRSGSYGNLVKIDHGNGVQTWYAHCSKLYVKQGQNIEAGQKIAAVGSTGNSTGPHLHLEIRIDGKAVNPQKYLY